MCGLAGFLTKKSWELSNDDLVGRMALAIRHRGPDDAGTWADSKFGIALGHRRLSIVDLSMAGHQPMRSASKRYTVAFNGEIYNHLELRTELKASFFLPGCLSGDIAWCGHSDTETLLAGFDAWGIQDTIQRCNGMFAFAVWDQQELSLTLGVDRLGEKPMYFGWQGQGEQSTFLFGSEISALKVHPVFSRDIDRNAISLLMRYNYIPAPYSIYKGISKLEPGCLLTVSLAKPTPSIIRYWSATEVAMAGCGTPFKGSADQSVDALEALLKSSVQQQMMADVPLGAFLSGGIDSSTVVALMQAQSSRPVKTFTIGFDDKDHNEALYSKAVAKYLGTDHTELIASPKQILDVIYQLPTLYCEPFSDLSQIPTFLVSQLARQNVKVSLSGDGGDELFCGYNRYKLSANWWPITSAFPQAGRILASRGLTAVSQDKWNALIRPLEYLLPDKLLPSKLGDKLHKLAKTLKAANLDELYLGLVSNWDAPASLVIAGQEQSTLLSEEVLHLSQLDATQRMMLMDTITYLPYDILVKVDRACMGASLEGRMPFLDHRVVEFAWSLPQNLKMRSGVSKWVLRQLLYRYVPKELIERPKMGFSIPIDKLLRGPLRDWAEALLDESRLLREGYFYPAPIREKWAEHLSGKCNWQNHLWSVLMFQAWLEKQ